MLKSIIKEIFLNLIIVGVIYLLFKMVHLPFRVFYILGYMIGDLLFKYIFNKLRNK